MAAGSSRTWFIVPAAVVLLVVLGVWMARRAPVASRDHSGREDVRVVLAAPEGGGEAAAKALIERLVLLGLDSRIVRADDREIELTLRRVAEAEPLLQSVLRPEPLTFHLLAEPQRTPEELAALDESDPDGGPPGGWLGDGGVDPENPRPWILGRGREATREKADPSGLQGDEQFAIECIPPRPKGTPPPCALWRAEPLPRLSAQDIVDVKIGAHRQTEEPIVTLTFRPEAREALRAMAARAEGRMLALVAFGELASRPRIGVAPNYLDPEAGLLVITARTGDTDRRTAQERAIRISVASKLSPLPKLEVRSLEPVPSPGAGSDPGTE